MYKRSPCHSSQFPVVAFSAIILRLRFACQPVSRTCRYCRRAGYFCVKNGDGDSGARISLEPLCGTLVSSRLYGLFRRSGQRSPLNIAVQSSSAAILHVLPALASAQPDWR